jgi:uncharacterized protein (TIGR02646 family)
VVVLQLAHVSATTSLRRAQETLDATVDDASALEVVGTGSSPWTGMKRRLSVAQRHKCAYCEDYLRDRVVEVDHVRPKAATQYWWLAYAVPNLVATCRSCNNAKSSKWQLQPRARKLRPREQPWHRAERAMLVDPTADDPKEHITYVFHAGLWRIASLTSRGLWTISAIQLDRDSFTYEANEFILEAVDPIAKAVKAAAASGDTVLRDQLLDKLSELSRPETRWTHLRDVVRDAVISGAYQRPDPHMLGLLRN